MGALARDLSRSMSRSLASIGATMGRAVRDAGRYEPPQFSGERSRVELPPDLMEQISENSQPYRRSRARMLARKWRLGRVRANPIGYAAGIAALVVMLVVTVGVGGVGAVYGIGVYDKHRADIQDIYNLKFDASTQIFDRNGVLLYAAHNDQGVNFYKSLDQISMKVQKGTIDTEDPSFYSNIGIDFYGTLRAVVSNTSSGDTTGQGGSTITQQLVKRMVLKDSDKSYQRKINEMFLAYGVTANYQKSQILEMYLNSIDYGELNQGIEAAAQNFFGLQDDARTGGTTASQKLTWAQAALLVALPNSPSRFQPNQFSCDAAPCDESKWDNPCRGNPHEAVCDPNPRYQWQSMGHEWLDYRRGLLVLDKLHQYQDISDKDYADAKTQLHDILTEQKVYHQAGPVNSTGNGQDFGKRAPLFVDYILEQLIDDFGVENPQRAGLRIYTTLDYNITEYAEKQLKYYILEQHDLKWIHYCGSGSCKNVPPLAQTANAHNGAMVAIDPHNGDIIGFVGSVDYGNPDKRVAGYIDMTGATKGPGQSVVRSMGSSAKGVIYTTAFQMGWNPATMLQDQPICFDGSPQYISDPGKPDDGQLTHDDFAPGCDGLYVPHNFEDTSFSGNIPIRFALGSSLNVPATEAMTFISGSTSRQGDTLQAMAGRVGINWPKGRYGPSTALGTIEMPMIDLANFYATVADGGMRHPYRSILRIEAADGTPLYQAPANPQGEQVISPEASYMLTSVLTDDAARVPVFNSPNPLSFPNFPVAAKTGTAQGKIGPSDIVTMGYSPYLAMGVWMGNTNNDDMAKNTIGIAGAGYVFSDVMQWAIDNYKWPKVAGFPIPSDMARGQFNCVTGLAPFQGETIAPCKLNKVSPEGVNLYVGYGGDSRINEDWYIKGQGPLQS
jgi:membrane peptidoglycan carboxypeptidase